MKIKHCILSIGFALCVTASSFAQTQTLTIDNLWQLKRVADPQLSPSATELMYLEATTDMAANTSLRNIVVVNSKTGGAPRTVLNPSDKAFMARWHPDGKRIGFLSSKNGSAQLWEMNADGTDKKQVTDIPDGFNFFVYSPDGNSIAVGKDVQVEPTIQEMYPDLDKVKGRIYDGLNYRHWDTWNDGSYTHIWVIKLDGNRKSVAKTGTDIMNGQAYDAPLKPFGGAEQIAWTPDGKGIAYTSKKEKGTAYAYSTNSDIYLYDIASGTEKNLTESNKGYDINPAFSPDGKTMAYLSMKTPGYESDKNRLMVLDMKTLKPTELTANLDRTADAFKWSKDGKNVYAIIQDMATKQIYKFNPKNTKYEIITKGDHDYISLEVGGNKSGEVIVGGKMSISQPVELYYVNQNGGETPLTNANKKALSEIKMGKVEKRMIKATDGKDILTWVIFPPDFDPAKKYPTLLYCQGGPQSAVSSFFSSRWNFQLMASYGYIVVAPNRRGLQSFGQEWNDAIIGDYGGQPMTDLMSAITSVAKEKYVDTARIGAVGASFGGYTVYWLAGHNQNRLFKSFIAHCGMYNMESWYGSTEEMFFAKNDQKAPYWENPENYRKFSPHNFAKNWNTPILIIHNEKDYRVPLTQGLDAFTAAQEQGIPSRFLYFPDENHWVLKPQNGLLWQRVFFDWLDRSLMHPMKKK